MIENQTENQILPFFFAEHESADTQFDYVKFTSYDGYSVFACASLFSAHIDPKKIREYLKFGIKEIRNKFDGIDLPVLDRMKESIFQAGDMLADHLIDAKEEVDDVDFSVCLLAIQDGVLYVWIDGNLNLRIYRGTESLLVNGNLESQFYGSTGLELGDILAVSFNKYVEEFDERIENYVLEKEVPVYPALFVDYQVENIASTQLLETPSESFQTEESVEGLAYHGSLQDTDEDLERAYGQSEPVTSQDSLKFTVSKLGLSDKLSQLKQLDLLNKAQIYLKTAGIFIWNILLAITSGILDFFYKFIFRKNAHQVKRFQASYQKKYLQYLLIFAVIIFGIYTIIFRSNPSTASKSGDNSSILPGIGKSEQAVKNGIQADYDKLSQYYDAARVDDFNQSFASLKTSISSAKSNGFSDTAFLDNISFQAQNLEDKLYRITSITKVDQAFTAASIAKANLTDFSVINNDIYAVDKGNSQILKSTAPDQFQTFASDSRLTALSKISCKITTCYLIDENKGIAILNVTTKTFTLVSGTESLGKTAKEIITFVIDNKPRLYVLVPSAGKVFRYDKAGETLGKQATWNSEAGFGMDTQDFAIDGSIFELSSNGVLRRFYTGKNDTSLKGLQEANPKLGSALQVAVTDARDPAPGVRNRMYIADSANKRIVVYDKDPNPSNQYLFKGSYKYRGTDKIGFENFQQIVLSGDEQFLYVLENNTVYKIQVGL